MCCLFPCPLKVDCNKSVYIYQVDFDYISSEGFFSCGFVEKNKKKVKDGLEFCVGLEMV